jgi:hypothetical protein
LGDSETNGKQEKGKFTKSVVKDHKDISAQQIVKCLVENGDLIPRKDGMLIGLIAEEDIEWGLISRRD